MQNTLAMTDEIVLTIKDFAKTINASPQSRGDMSSLIHTTSRLKLANFDYWESLIRYEFRKALDESAPLKRIQWLKPKRKTPWLDMVSWDGYERENSLHILSGSAPNAFFLALLIRRLNDWVPQVRKTARIVLPSIIKETPSEYLVDAMCVTLLSWYSWERIRESDKQSLFSTLSTKKVAKLLKSKLISSTSGPMPTLLSQLGHTSVLDGYLDEIANEAMQPHVRAKAYRSLFEKRIFWIVGQEWQWTDKAYGKRKLIAIINERKIEVQTPFLELLYRSATDRSAIVRQISAEFLIRNIDSLGHQSRVFAEKFAADRSSNVAERGQFVLKKLDEMTLDKNGF